MSLIANAISYILDVMQFAIFAVVLMSWIPQARDSKFGEIIRLLTDPILMPIREFSNKLMGEKASMIDLSPLFAIIILNLLQKIVAGFK